MAILALHRLMTGTGSQCSGRQVYPTSLTQIHQLVSVGQAWAGDPESDCLPSSVGHSGPAYFTATQSVPLHHPCKGAWCESWQAETEGFTSLSDAKHSGTAAGLIVTSPSLAQIDSRSEVREKPCVVNALFKAQTSKGRGVILQGWGLFLGLGLFVNEQVGNGAFGLKLVDILVDRPPSFVHQPVAPDSATCTWPVDVSLEGLRHNQRSCSLSAHEPCSFQSINLSWSPHWRVLYEYTIHFEQCTQFLHSVAMPLPGTPVGGERPSKATADAGEGVSTPSSRNAEEAAKAPTLDLFDDPVVALPEQLYPPKRRLGCYAVQALRFTIRLDVTEAKPTVSTKTIPGPSCLKEYQASKSRRRSMAAAKVLAKSGLRCQICHRQTGSCVHTRLERPDPAYRKMAAHEMLCMSRSHCLGTAATAHPQSVLSSTCSRSNQVTSFCPAVSSSAEPRCLEQSRTSAVCDSTGRGYMTAEGFTSPFWKPPGDVRAVERGRLMLLGEHVPSSSLACCTDDCVLKWPHVTMLLSTSSGSWALSTRPCRLYCPWLAELNLLNNSRRLVITARGHIWPMSDESGKDTQSQAPQTTARSCAQPTLTLRTKRKSRRLHEVSSASVNRRVWHYQVQQDVYRKEAACILRLHHNYCCAVNCLKVGRLRAKSYLSQYALPAKYNEGILRILDNHILVIFPNRHFCERDRAMHPWKSRSTLQRQGTRPGKRQRDAAKEERERNAMHQHDRPNEPCAPPARREALAHASTWPSQGGEALPSVGSAWVEPIACHGPGQHNDSCTNSATGQSTSSHQNIQALPLTAVHRAVDEEALDAPIGGQAVQDRLASPVVPIEQKIEASPTSESSTAGNDVRAPEGLPATSLALIPQNLEDGSGTDSSEELLTSEKYLQDPGEAEG